MKDMFKKGRGCHGATVFGSKNGSAKMTEESVHQMREMKKLTKLKDSEIGKIFGISRSQVGSILRNENWKE
jgi:hypothetical protein